MLLSGEFTGAKVTNIFPVIVLLLFGMLHLQFNCHLITEDSRVKIIFFLYILILLSLICYIYLQNERGCMYI